MQDWFFLLNNSKAVRKSELEGTSLRSHFLALWNTELKFFIGCFIFFFFLNMSLKNTVPGLSTLQVGVSSAADVRWHCFVLLIVHFIQQPKTWSPIHVKFYYIYSYMVQG